MRKADGVIERTVSAQRTMNFKTTIVLLVVLLAVGAVIFFTRESGRNETETSTPARLLEISPGDVTRVASTADEGQHIALEKKDGKWKLVEPLEAPADDSAAESLVETVAGLQTRGKIDASGANASTTGLDSPRFKLELSTRQGKTIKLDIGNRSAAGDNLYVRLDGQDRADVVPAEIFDQLDKPLKQWRREKLLDVASTDIKQIRIASTQPTLAMEQDSAQKWTMSQPASMPADSTAVSDLAMAVANLRAADFVSDRPENANKYGLDQPVLTVSFSTQASPPPPPATQPASQPAFTSIRFGRYDDVLKKNVYASISNQPGVVKVAASTLDEFRKAPLDLRDKNVMTVDPERVMKISIAIDKPATTQPASRPAVNQTVVLERARQIIGPPAPKAASAPTTLAGTGPTSAPATAEASTRPAQPPSKWNLASKGGADADDSKVDSLLAEFHPLRADKYLQTSPAAAKSVATYTVMLDGADARHEMRFVDPGNGQPVVGQYNGLTFEVARWLIDRFDEDFARGAKSSKPPAAPPLMGGQ